MVEAAFILPVLITFVFGSIDFARMYRTREQLQQAARDGVAFAQFNPSKTNSTCTGSANGSDIYDKILASDTGLPISPTSDITLYHGTHPTPSYALVFTQYADPCKESFKAGDYVKVTVSHTLSIFTPGLNYIVGNTIKLSASATVQVQL